MRFYNVNRSVQAGLIKGGAEMINSIVRLKDDTVMVFDERGGQVLAYQGQYDIVRERILRDAPHSAVFLHWFGNNDAPQAVGRKEW